MVGAIDEVIVGFSAGELAEALGAAFRGAVIKALEVESIQNFFREKDELFTSSSLIGGL